MVMKDRNFDTHPYMKWEVMDARFLKFKSNSFDLVIDKCTSDNILGGSYPSLSLGMMLDEVQRVLKVGGKYVIITHPNHHEISIHLRRSNLKFNIENFNFLKGD